MKLLLFFLGSLVLMALWSQRRDALPGARLVWLLVVVVTFGYLSRRMI